MAVKLAHLCQANSYPLRLRRVTCFQAMKKGAKNDRFGALKPDRLGLSFKANHCSDAGTGHLGVLSTEEPALLESCFGVLEKRHIRE